MFRSCSIVCHAMQRAAMTRVAFTAAPIRQLHATAIAAAEQGKQAAGATVAPVAGTSATPSEASSSSSSSSSPSSRRRRRAPRRRNADWDSALSTGAARPQRTQRPRVASQKELQAKEKLNLAHKPEIQPATPSAGDETIPKQKVQMYTKMLRVLRSPVKGAVRNTDGDDYVLDQDETKPTSMFTGLISANLSGAGRRGAGKKSGTGDMYVNGIRYVEYFSQLDHRWELCAPFYYTNTLSDFDMIAVVRGGGPSGQAGAIKHATAKALQAYDRARYRPMLKKKFLLSRDSRVVERKKYGQKKARKKFTFVKR